MRVSFFDGVNVTGAFADRLALRFARAEADLREIVRFTGFFDEVGRFLAVCFVFFAIYEKITVNTPHSPILEKRDCLPVLPLIGAFYFKTGTNEA